MHDRRLKEVGRSGVSDDRSALRAACEPGVGLCTIVGIEGSFSRRLGAQLAVHPDGEITGSLADGCLEKQLAGEVAAASAPVVKRFGAGSELIDFRLPCGSGLDVLIDPAPDRAACMAAMAELDGRRPAFLPLPSPQLTERRYIPPLRLLLFGEGPELEALLALAWTAGIEADCAGDVSLGQPPEGAPGDRWTAIELLFHDHEWEQPILKWALAGEAFHIGAQGGLEARRGRVERLEAAGVTRDQIGRIRSPVGLIHRSREPRVLALSVLAEVVGEYEQLHPYA